MKNSNTELILTVDTGLGQGSLSIWNHGLCIDAMKSVDFLPESNLVKKADGLLMLIDRILKKNNFRLDELDLIVVSDNPGSQTGLRTGMAAVKGLADSLEIKFIRFSVLESLAVISGFNGSINVILDSEKNNNVYFQTITVFPNLKIQKTEIERLSIDTVKNKLINSGENFVISASLRWHFKDLKFDNATSKILFTDTDIPAKILGKHYLSLKSDFCESD